MRRIALAERPNWKTRAEELGFHFHTMYGEAYWDETSAYAFTLDQIERDIEDPSTELHGMCVEAAGEIMGSEELMEAVGIPPAYRDLVATSFRAGEPALYGRFDLAYDGMGPAKLLEYNADTPTSLYEAAAFQWLWLEDMRASGALAAFGGGEPDQFNGIHDALVARLREINPPRAPVHFASVKGDEEDFATVEYMAWCAKEAGLSAHYVAMEEIGLTGAGQFADAESRVMGTLFKLYPWENMLAEPFAAHIAGSGCRMIEPAWKAVVSNKGLLPVLWRMFEGHPNLLPAFFESEMTSGDRVVANRRARAGEALSRGRVTKPLFSREGASVDIEAGDGRIGAGGRIVANDRTYDAHPRITQAYVDLPALGDPARPVFPVLGAWIVGDSCVGLGIREDASRITQNLSRFKPHFIFG